MLIGKIEISQNFEYLITLPGFGKILTLVCGAIAMGLGGYSYEKNEDRMYWRENLFIDFLGLILVVSFFYLLAHVMSYDLVIHRINRWIDTGYHAFSGLILFIVGPLMLASAVDLDKTECKSVFSTFQYCFVFGEKLGAGVMAIIDGLVYGTTALLIYKAKAL